MRKTDICVKIIHEIKNLLCSPECRETYRSPGRFIRKRLLSFYQVVIYLLYSSKASMFTNISLIRSCLPEIDFPSVTKQAVSKARQFINPALFQDLFHLSVDLFYKLLPERKTWNGFHLFAIDGSKIELPNSKSNFETFGEMFGYPDPSRKYTQALASIVYDVLEDHIVHASMHRFLASERSAALEHLKSLECLGIYKDSVVIFDRGYYSRALFRYCVDHGHFCVMRLKERLQLSRSCHGDQETVLPGDPEQDIPDTKIRVIEVTLDDGSKEYLATNIFDTRITADMFRELYFYRWPVESKYMELKCRLKLEEFNGATSVSMVQEFFINMLLSNLCSLIKNDVDEEIDKNRNPSNKYRYQANRTFIIGQMQSLFPQILCGRKTSEAVYLLKNTAFKNRSQIIPNRKFPRKRKNSKGRTHFRNIKTAY